MIRLGKFQRCRWVVEKWGIPLKVAILKGNIIGT